MSSIENAWQVSPEHVELQWVSLWLTPHNPDKTPYAPIWPFTVDEAVERLNQWLGCLGSDFKIEPDPLLSNDHYVWMEMRDHLQAVAVAMLGRMAAQTLLDERSQS